MNLIQNKEQWPTFVNTIINLTVLKTGKEILSTGANVGFSKWTQVHVCLCVHGCVCFFSNFYYCY
jgi:hypothetical protein